MSVHVELDTLIRFNAGIRKTITAGLLDAGNAIEELASQLAPVDTTELQNSGLVQVIDEFTVEVSFGNGIGDDRAPVQEFGSVFNAAQPYLLPAVKEISVEKYILDRIESLKG